jgi:hypothetical protein
MQDAFSDVDRDDLSGAILEQAIRESPGRGAEVCADHPGYAELERLERSLELLTPSRNEARLLQEFDGCPWPVLAGRLQRHLAFDPDTAGHDQPLRLRPAFSESSLDEQDIDSLFFHLIPRLLSWPPGRGKRLRE